MIFKSSTQPLCRWCAKPKFPGDTVRIQNMTRGAGSAQEFGDVRIQWYDHASVRVGVFLPGRYVFNDGDTPKVEPEQSAWCGSRAAADSVFDLYARQAEADGWRPCDAHGGVHG